jgi:hypothetical protein
LQPSVDQAGAAVGDRRGHQSTLEAAIKGAHPVERAGVVLALVAGMQVMRQMMEIPALAEADPDVLIGILTPVLRTLVEDSPAS